MTKVLVVSDSHGLTSELLELKKRHSEVEVFLHCGDSELDQGHDAIISYTTVRGNCDYEEGFQHDELVVVGGVAFLVTHGHLYGVKSSLMKLHFKAQELGADIVCFGHSHILGVEQIGKTLFLNPGSIRLPRGRNERTYVILEITDDKNITYSVFDYEQGELIDLRHTFNLFK